MGMKNIRLVNIITHPLPFPREKDSLERPIAKALSRAAERLVDSLKINSVSEKAGRGRRLITKRRNGYSEPLAELTNLYFRIARVSIRFLLEHRKMAAMGTEVLQHAE
jgi:hypothetical protein